MNVNKPKHDRALLYDAMYYTDKGKSSFKPIVFSGFTLHKVDKVMEEIALEAELKKSGSLKKGLRIIVTFKNVKCYLKKKMESQNFQRFICITRVVICIILMLTLLILTNMAVLLPVVVGILSIVISIPAMPLLLIQVALDFIKLFKMSEDRVYIYEIGVMKQKYLNKPIRDTSYLFSKLGKLDDAISGTTSDSANYVENLTKMIEQLHDLSFMQGNPSYEAVKARVVRIIDDAPSLIPRVKHCALNIDNEKINSMAEGCKNRKNIMNNDFLEKVTELLRASKQAGYKSGLPYPIKMALGTTLAENLLVCSRIFHENFSESMKMTRKGEYQIDMTDLEDASISRTTQTRKIVNGIRNLYLLCNLFEEMDHPLKKNDELQKMKKLYKRTRKQFFEAITIEKNWLLPNRRVVHHSEDAILRSLNRSWLRKHCMPESYMVTWEGAYLMVGNECHEIMVNVTDGRMNFHLEYEVAIKLDDAHQSIPEPEKKDDDPNGKPKSPDSISKKDDKPGDMPELAVPDSIPKKDDKLGDMPELAVPVFTLCDKMHGVCDDLVVSIFDVFKLKNLINLKDHLLTSLLPKKNRW